MWGDVPADDVIAEWAERLGEFTADDLRWALEASESIHRDYPPTCPQFVGLCRDAARARATTAVRIGGPPGVPCPPEVREQMAATIAGLRARAQTPGLTAEQQIEGLRRLGAGRT